MLLAPFLFIMEVDGLSGLIRRDGELGIYLGFKVGKFGLVVTHLLYVDATLLDNNPSLDNLWCIKPILRGFERASDF